MSFPRYPAYKPSGVEWLGEVPEHWETLRLRFAVTLNPSKQEAKELGEQELVSFLPMEAIGEDGSLRLENERELAECLSGYTYFRDGDVCVAKITPCFENGKGAILRELKGGIGFGTTELIVARPEKEKITSEFLDYLFRSQTFRRLGESEMYGAGGQKRVPDSFIRDFTAALPSIEEQNQATTFLGHETAKIDALIAEQQRLIELLQEKRQAVISHTVTKGLNLDAPMKDSGVEWLGDVPEHWDLKRGRFLYRKREEETRDTDEVVTAFRDGQVIQRSLRRTDGFTLAELEVGYQHVCAGDLVIHGMDAFAGAIGVSESEGKCTPEYSVCRPIDQRHANDYFAYALRVMAKRDYIYVICPSVRERAPRFRFQTFKDVTLPVPPSGEQASIAKAIKDECSKLSELAISAESLVALLQERRSALISAAVTGQIDVRGLVPEVEAA